jgi:hypothetical protein
VLAEPALLFRALLVGELARVTALARSAHAQVQELAAERFDLLARFRAHIETFDLRAEPLRGRDRLQAGDARTDHQHLRRTDRAGRRGQHREEARRQLRGDQGRLVPGHARLRTEHVHRLSARRARQPLQRESNDTERFQRRGTRRIGLRLQGANQHRATLQARDRFGRRRLHAQH